MRIKRGDDVKLEFTFTDVDDVAIDLTECDIFFTVKRYVSDLDSKAVIIKDFVFVGGMDVIGRAIGVEEDVIDKNGISVEGRVV